MPNIGMMACKRTMELFDVMDISTVYFSACGKRGRLLAVQPKQAVQGFTLIELVMVMVILGILGATAISAYANLGSDARIASIKGLAGAVNSSLSIARAFTAVRGQGTAGTQVNITWINIDAATPVRLWNGYPDRWCDGIGMMLTGTSVSPGGCYLSTAAVSSGSFTFYGYGNGMIPNGDAGWRIENAPDPRNCAVGYRYGGTGTPAVIVYTGGC